MRAFYLLPLLLVAVGFLPGCFAVTRVERDLYTITERDTTVREDVNNPPGDRDNGTIYPSPRTVEIERRYVQRDSTVERFYPAFLRFGGIETASFISAGGSSDGSGRGLFGLYELLNRNSVDDSKIFTANMYRFMPYEVRLRWLGDAPNWTFGSSALEIFIQQKDSSAELSPGEYLMGIASPYIRKRFFFREKPPYIMVVPFIGLGIAPSQYVNLGTTLAIGSYGGFNVRAYAGYISGTTALIRADNDPQGEADYSMNFPYFGIGVSALDFVNKTEELFIEWKDHDHSAFEVSVANLDLIYASVSDSGTAFAPNSETSSGSFPTGLIFRLASGTFPLPIGDNRFYVGTSLFNLMWLSDKNVAFGFLPLRVGYRFNPIYENLHFQPFGEITYFPSTAFHLGARLAAELPVSEIPLTVNAVAGYVSGSTNLDVLANFDVLEAPDSFSGGYIGIGVGVGVFHTLEEVMRQ